jgi:hypothetical protein
MGKKTQFLFFLSLALGLSIPSAQADSSACPSWVKDANLPECPPSGMISENYPTAVVVVSDRGFGTGIDPSFTRSVVEKVLVAAEKNSPMILLPVTQETYDSVVASIRAMKIPKATKDRYIASLVHLNNDSYTWQQDYQQAFINPNTGRPLLRPVDSYVGQVVTKDEFSHITDQLKSCGYETGPPMVPQTITDSRGTRLPTGAYGGNIEALPGGICAVGSDNFQGTGWKDYTDQFCGANRLQTPTSWLAIGHTDEIMKVVKDSHQKPPCDFAVTIASPRKAIEVLKKHPKDPFISLPDDEKNIDRQGILDKYHSTEALSTLCQTYLEDLKNHGTPNEEKDHPSTPTEGFNFNIFRFLQVAHARVAIDPMAPAPTSEDEFKQCIGMTNADVVRLLSQDNDFKKYNDLVQKQMDDLKNNVQIKMAKSFPSCKASIIEMPDLFYGGPVVIKDDGSMELPNNSGLSILPNPTNAISVGNTVISPEPYNNAFKQSAQETYKSLGGKSNFVDTFDYAHTGQGNLHCSTNTFHVCKPRGK